MKEVKEVVVVYWGKITKYLRSRSSGLFSTIAFKQQQQNQKRENAKNN